MIERGERRWERRKEEEREGGEKRERAGLVCNVC